MIRKTRISVDHNSGSYLGYSERLPGLCGIEFLSRSTGMF